MNKNKNKLYIIGLLLTVLFMGSCELEDRTYQGPLYYEYSPVECGQTISSNIFVKEADKKGEDKICVQLVKPAGFSVSVKFRVVDQLYYVRSSAEYTVEKPELAEDQYDIYENTAQYGVDYTFESSTTPVNYDEDTHTGVITIPEGEMFGYIPVNILKRNGHSAFIVLEDSENARANKPTSILNLKLTAEKTYYFDEPLDEGIPESWSLLDKDGDGLGWYFYESWGMVISDSYDYDTESPVSPENYLITPLITLPDDVSDPVLTFELAASATNAYQEKYKVVLSETPLTLENCNDAVVLRDYTELTEAYHKKTFQLEQIDLSPYKGKSFYIGFVHGDCTDMESLILRNVVVYGY